MRGKLETERRVAIFRNGHNQAVRIPRDFELEGNEAIMRKEGNRLIIEPVGRAHRLIALLKSLSPIEEPFPQVPDPPVSAEAPRTEPQGCKIWLARDRP